MGTTRKLAIAAYQATHPQANKQTKPLVPGSFLGMGVALAASCITGASAQNDTNLGPGMTGGGYVYTPPAATLDITAFAVLGAAAGVAIIVGCTALICHKAVNKFATGARIEPLSDVIVYNNPGYEVLGIAYEAQAPATNPRTPAALLGVKEGFVENESGVLKV